MNVHLASQALLAAVVADGSSAIFPATLFRRFTFYIEAAGTVAGTTKIQSLAPSGTWVDLDSRVLSAAGTTVVQLEGAFSALRATLASRTNGTFTVGVDASSI